MAAISHLLCQMGGGGPFQKALTSPLSLVLGVWNEKTASWKSWSANLLQVLNLTFDPCFVIILKGAYISQKIDSIASKYENNL